MNKLEITNQYKKIMILVPHQDDEILMSAGIIYTSKKEEIDIKVAIVTNGDYACSDYSKGKTRLRETIIGTQCVGLSENELIFLGYADTGMPEEESFLMKLYRESDENKIYKSSCSDKTYGLEEKSEFHMEQCGIHASYTRKHLKEDLKTMIMSYEPDCIFTTCEYDWHGDHSALFFFTKEILKELEEKENYHPALYCGLIHSCAGDEMWPRREGNYFDCPKDFDKNGVLKWEERYSFSMPVELSVQKQKDNLKYQALLKYETALEPNAVEFLMSFIKDEEIFWKIQ